MNWPPRFLPIERTDHRQSLEAELVRELGQNHPLYGLPIAAAARRLDQDDVLFELRDGTSRVAEVHLTWSGKCENLPWPVTTLFNSFDDWVEARSTAEI